MRYLIIFISLLFITATGQAQDSAQNVISVQATAEEVVPADEISFRIMLNAEADTPQKAHEAHKKREKILVDLLDEHQIREKNIDFEPISISKRYNNRPAEHEQESVVTRQQVILALDRFDVYEKIQIALIENGFDEFSGRFTSSESERAEDEALRKALQTAREKADIIARETRLRIVGIKDISYSYNGDPPRPMMEMRAASDSGGLMNFDQTVSISASVTVNYRVEN